MDSSERATEKHCCIPIFFHFWLEFRAGQIELLVFTKCSLSLAFNTLGKIVIHLIELIVLMKIASVRFALLIVAA